MRCLRAKTALIAVLTLGLPTSGWAQAGPDAAAVGLVQQATEAYRGGRYQAAAELFISAFELSSAPIQLRNAAKAYAKAEAWTQAAQTWRRYRDLPELSAGERAEAEAELRALDERQAALRSEQAALQASAEAEAARAQAEAAEAEAARARAELKDEQARPLLGYILVGAGALSVAASAVLFFHADSRLGHLDEGLGRTDAQGRITGVSVATAEDELAGINRERTVSGVLLGVGLSAALGGTLVWVLSGDGEPPVQVGVAPRPGGGLAQVAFEF